MYTFLVMVILIGDNLHALLSPFTSLSSTKLTILSTLVILPTALTSKLELLSYFSIIGTLSSLLLSLAIIVIGVINQDEGSWLHPAQTEVFTDINRAPLSIGLVLVGFAGIYLSLYLSIYLSIYIYTRGFTS